MRPPRLAWLILPLGLVSLSAAPTEDARRWVMRADAAYQGEDYQAAIDCYTAAEGRTTDPGLVAFNKAAALYRLGRYREAELNYLRSREDATGERLARLLYDLGNCLVQEGQDRDARVLGRAVAAYDECLREPGATPALVEDARYNREVARALLLRARANAGKPNPDDPRPDDRDPGRPPDDERPRPRGWATGQSDATAGVEGGAEPAGDPATQAMPSSQNPPPGVGNLPPIPDQDRLVPMSPEDTTAYIRQVVERVRRERREHARERSAPPAPNVKDW
jgi:tetratricopeptide (TPR) repeat protein